MPAVFRFSRLFHGCPASCGAVWLLRNGKYVALNRRTFPVLSVSPNFRNSLARSATWHTRAARAYIATSNANTSPSPAATRSAQNVNLLGTRRYRSSNILNGKISNRNTRGWSSSWRAVLVILFDDDTVRCDVRESNTRVCYVLDRARGIVDGLDADTVVGVRDCVVSDVNIRDIC